MAMIYRITSNVQEVLRAAAEQKTRAISEERLTQAGHYSPSTGTSLCTCVIEAPCTERYARWCDRSGLLSLSYLIAGCSFFGFDVSRLTTPFRKCVSSKRSKKTNNPNPSPIKKMRFGLFLSGAGGGGRTRTTLLSRDFKSRASAYSATPASLRGHINILL